MKEQAAVRRIYDECRQVAPFVLEGDYYPLTRYSRESSDWIAWQFNRPEEGDGVVQAFRRGESAFVRAEFRLRGLDPAAMYEVTNFDVAGSTTVCGKALMEQGLSVEIRDRPGAAVIVYRKRSSDIKKGSNMKEKQSAKQERCMSASTTAYINNQQQTYQTVERCHDGVGPLMLKDVIGAFGNKQFIKFIHDDIVPPGTTIGYHQHAGGAPFEEWYYVISGEGIMRLDGEDHLMRPGDISVCLANGHHGIRNTGTEDLRIMVICAGPI